ncbi:MAG TPA: GNAT family N-acetyltransferase [Tepidisphaeraceae bacterium]|jgi:L-amino acid N-acyltransferase YncA|nr:GNAT family N-acetyltransferase [Tepidisphaeraceae bacterium]
MAASASNIRPATEADLVAINDIYNYYVRCSTCTYQDEPSSLSERRDWFAGHGPSHPVVVYQEGSEVGGWASLSRFHARSAYRHTVENSVYVRSDLHGRGIGSVLLGHSIEQARQLGHRTILALIDADQTASIAIHRKFGFEEVAHLRQVGFKFGRWLDVVYLQLLL